MSEQLVKSYLIIVLLGAIVAIMFALLATPALAAAPPLAEETWTSTMLCAPGRCGNSGHERDDHSFEAPPGAVEAEVEVWWVWSGSPGEIQKNEIFRTSVGVDCNRDPGDGIPPQKCGETRFNQSTDLTVTATHVGYIDGPDGQTAGSVEARVIVRWYPGPTSCDALYLNPNQDHPPLRVTAEIKATNTQSAKIDWGDGNEERLPPGVFSAEHTFYDPDINNVTAWVQDSAGRWIGSKACAGDVEVWHKSGHVRATKIDQNGQPWSGVTVNLYRADNTFVKSKKTPAFFGPLAQGNYYIEEVVPAGSEPISETRFDFTLDENNLYFEAQFQNMRQCMPLDVSPTNGIAPLKVKATTDIGEFVTIDWDDGPEQEMIGGVSTADQAAEHIYVEPGRYNISAQVVTDGKITTRACAHVLVEEPSTPTTGQYQGFNGPVAFGSYTPYLEPGKEYFDMTRSVMFNVEYIEGNQGDVVYRFNGQEISGVSTSIFNVGTFEQVESVDGRAVTALNEGVTKLIAYRYGVERARIFQTLAGADTRWIHPLEQPFEHKYVFELELHGPARASDLLVYGDNVHQVRYDQNGLAVVSLSYDQPGLVSIYPDTTDLDQVSWITVDRIILPGNAEETLSYDFDEIGLYHYRILDPAGQVVAGPSSKPGLQLLAGPGLTYLAQLVYPATSLFVGLYDDMQFKHPDYWTMPVDGRAEHEFEFHLDYHRLSDPDLANDHIRGDVVVDGLTLSYGTTSVAQQFPYGRHDNARPGVNLVGIPNVSMIAFCQRPGFHEVVYWGGWENESYYLPGRAWIYDQVMADKWNDDQRGDCIDAARRVNMELARQGLRTDHTFRHHGERSQGYQMVQQSIWSPYNLVGMRSPHLGQIFKPGKQLAYYEDPEDLLFWGWDLDIGGLANGIGAYELQQHVASLGPAQYVDMTGIHSPEDVYVPAPPAPRPELEPAPATTPEPPVQQQPISSPATPTPTPVPATPTPEPPTPGPEPPTPTLEPPVLEPQPPSEPTPLT